MSASSEAAEHAHDRIKLQALDVVEAALVEKGVTATSRDTILISLAVEAGIAAAIAWMTDRIESVS